MLSEYIEVGMRRARYEILEDENFYGEIPACPGVYASAATLEDCREQLREVFEEWILFRVYRNLDLPTIDGIHLEVKEAA